MFKTFKKRLLKNSNSRSTGQLIEQQAAHYLQQQGLLLEHINYHSRHGEIDLIMLDNTSLVFIEVRYRKNKKFGSGAESVNISKQTKIIKTAEHYLQKYKVNKACRFDVISASDINNDSIKLEWIKNAFSA